MRSEKRYDTSGRQDIPAAGRKDGDEGETDRLAEIGDLKSSYKSDGVTVIDARSAAEFNGTGGRASLDAFALELAGFSKVENYYHSWQEWSADRSVPVETTKP